MLSYYEILQVKKDASSADIKKAYRKLCKILHPDLHNNSKESNTIFNLLHEAYDTLSDPVKKRKYNPDQHSSNASSFDFSTDKYDEIIGRYKKIVKDYEQILKKKDNRERELLNEIKKLKETNAQQKNTQQTSEEYYSFEDDKEEDVVYDEDVIDIKDEEIQEEHLNEQTDAWTVLGYILFGIILIGILIFFIAIPDAWWFIFALVGLPIWLIVSAFK